MLQVGEPSSSTPPPPNLVSEKPIVVRVKRKSSQAPLDAFWLEINERPYKRPLLDVQNLSISNSTSAKVPDEAGKKKLLVQHIETIGHSETVTDVLHSILQLDGTGLKELKRKIVVRKRSFKQVNRKQDQLRSVAREKLGDLAKSARFEQIWKRRRGVKDAADDSLRAICHLYDVVRVDNDEKPGKVQQQEDSSFEDDAILCNYLPLIREFLPDAAAEIESNMLAYPSREDNYVYDLYTLGDCADTIMEEARTDYPLVQVDDDDDFYDGPLDSEYETDDSNAEDNPMNDYPDEDSFEEGDDDKDSFDDVESQDLEYEKEVIDVDDEEDWRWQHR
ncbi:RNA-directed DNA methylation 4 isoform X1 [Typha latifolia]|uniref:RNA-directed DNA methylation 4 isoform X1 n=1 Tax=Typha latifolia TaxID=4733 RepID=UPI003C2F41A4